MAANATLGTLLKQGSNTIAQRVRIKPNEFTRAKLETTDLDSTWETSIAGIKRAGELECEINYDAGNATHAALWTLFGSGATDSFSLTLLDAGGAVFAFDAWISGLSVGEAKVDGIQTATIKFQLTGTVTLTP